jgi:hypothetical protein
LGRHVRKGEKAIAIIAPVLRRKAAEESNDSANECVVSGFLRRTNRWGTAA